MAFQPMPLSRKPQPFDHPEWVFELKYDGFRSLAVIHDGRCELISRNDIDQQSIAKTLGNMKSLQKDVHTLTMAATKMSTFGIVVIEGEGDDARPTAFSITARQRETFLADVRELKKKKDTYVDLCADILLSTLTTQLRTSPER